MKCFMAEKEINKIMSKIFGDLIFGYPNVVTKKHPLK